jgi:protease I
MKKILMIIAPNNFQDNELLIPKRIFQDAKFEVTIASENTEKARGSLGAVTKVDIDISNVNVSDYNAIVFVGGPGVMKHKLYENNKILDLAKTASYKGKIVAAICIAPMILANAGLLTKRKATVFPSAADYLKEKGALYEEKPVVKDGNIITACGPDAAKEFAEAIKKSL